MWGIKMSKSKKISELPDFRGKEILIDAQEQGIEIFSSTDFNGIVIIGLSNIIYDLQQEINSLKKQCLK